MGPVVVCASVGRLEEESMHMSNPLPLVTKAGG